MTNNPFQSAPLPELLSELAPSYVEPDPFDAPDLRWGILGAGGIARTFATDVPKYSNQKIVAVGSRQTEGAKQFALEFDLDPAKAHGSYQALVDDPDVDAIYIATPHIRHKEDALLALRAGKPVLVEKSFTMSETEATEVFEEADRQGLFAMEAMWSRHLPHYAWIRQVIDSGVMGDLVYFNADHGQSLLHVPRLVEPALGGGAMLDLGVYPMHFQQMVLSSPKSIQSASRLTDQEVDSGDVVVSQYQQGIAISSCEMDCRTPTSALLGFEGGTIQLSEQFYRPTNVKVQFHESHPSTMEIIGSHTAVWDATVPGGFQYEAAEAARCIAAGKTQSEVVPWSATLEVQRMMDQVLRNAGYFGR